MLERHLVDASPPYAEYRLTDRGRRLARAVQAVLRALVGVPHSLDDRALIHEPGERQHPEDVAPEPELDRAEPPAALGDPLPGGHLALDLVLKQVSAFGAH